MIGSSVAARRAAHLLNYEELLPLAQGPFIFVVMGRRCRKTSAGDDAGVVRQAVGFLSHITVRELTIPRKATWYVAICGWQFVSGSRPILA